MSEVHVYPVPADVAANTRNTASDYQRRYQLDHYNIPHIMAAPPVCQHALIHPPREIP